MNLTVGLKAGKKRFAALAGDLVVVVDFQIAY